MAAEHNGNTTSEMLDRKHKIATVRQKCWIGGTNVKPFVKHANEGVYRSSEMLSVRPWLTP